MIFGGFVRVGAREVKNRENKDLLVHFGCRFLCFFCSLLRALLRALRRRENRKKVKIHWFLWVGRRMRLFRAEGEAIKF